MKEASGELSMTAVAVVAIAAVGVLFATVIWPNISRSLNHSQACSASWGCTNCKDGKCECRAAKPQGTKATCADIAASTVAGNTNECSITCDDPNTKKVTK